MNTCTNLHLAMCMLRSKRVECSVSTHSVEYGVEQFNFQMRLLYEEVHWNAYITATCACLYVVLRTSHWAIKHNSVISGSRYGIATSDEAQEVAASLIACLSKVLSELRCSQLNFVACYIIYEFSIQISVHPAVQACAYLLQSRHVSIGAVWSLYPKDTKTERQ